MMSPMASARLKQDAGTAQKCHSPVKGQRQHLPKKQKEREKKTYTVEEKAPDSFSKVKECVKMVSASASITEEYPNTAPQAHDLKISK